MAQEKRLLRRSDWLRSRRWRLALEGERNRSWKESKKLRSARRPASRAKELGHNKYGSCAQ